MAKRNSKGPDTPAPFHAPFARLVERADVATALPRSLEAPPPRPTEQVAPRPARAVVRLERKGRGGKEATVIEKLGLCGSEQERWLKELKQALGCGGAIEGDALVLQGDLRQRVKPLLEARGVTRVTLG